MQQAPYDETTAMMRRRRLQRLRRLRRLPLLLPSQLIHPPLFPSSPSLLLLLSTLELLCLLPLALLPLPLPLLLQRRTTNQKPREASSVHAELRVGRVRYDLKKLPHSCCARFTATTIPSRRVAILVKFTWLLVT
jgi:hypothetical protein